MAESLASTTLVASEYNSTQADVSSDLTASVDQVQQGVENLALSSTDDAQSTNDIGAQDGDDEEPNVFEVESLCMNCHGDGMTKILLLKIPHFRAVLLESFECGQCGHKDNTVKSADQIQEKGSKFTLRLDKMEDLERQVIKSDSAIFWIEDLGLEMPPGPGQITNVEGVLIHILRDMESGQAQRRRENTGLADRIQKVIDRLINMMNGAGFPFKVSIDDPAGNSWIAYAHEDTTHNYFRKDYVRTDEQNAALGLGLQDDAAEEEQEEAQAPGEEAVDPLADVDILAGHVYAIPAHCHACARPCVVNTQMLSIPNFKEVIIMATVCEHCGFKSNEVKTGGAIPDKGKRITLKVKNVVDLSRDILKSQTCAIECPELALSVHSGTMGGRFTTVEGLLTQVRDDLRGKIFGVGDEDIKAGDSLTAEEKTRWDNFFNNLDKALKAEIEFTLVLEDPLASSYVQSLGDEKGEGQVDPQITEEDYDRTDEEEEELGLKDMKTEGYENDAEADDEPAVEGKNPVEAEPQAAGKSTATEQQPVDLDFDNIDAKEAAEAKANTEPAL